jgi:chromosome segregation ATPase
MPDTADSRLARVEQRVSDLDARVSALVPIANSVAILTERVETIRRDLAAYASQVSNLDTEIEKREEIGRQEQDANRKERRDARRAMWVLAVTIIAALISAGAVILTSSGVH